MQLGEYNSDWGSGPYALKQIAVYEAIAEHCGQNIHVNKDLPVLLKNAGFVDVRRTLLSGGISQLYTATRA